MKTLEEIKDGYAVYKGYTDWKDYVEYKGIILDETLDDICNIFAIEVAKEALKNASERDGCIFHENRKAIKYVAQELVLDESNIPPL